MFNEIVHIWANNCMETGYPEKRLHSNQWSEVLMAVQVFLPAEALLPAEVFLPARILVVQLWTFHFCSSQVLYLHIDIMTSQVLHTCCIKHTSQNWKLFKLHTENWNTNEFFVGEFQFKCTNRNSFFIIKFATSSC